MSRNYLLDNAKIILIFLVVFGHLIEPLIEGSTFIKIIYLVIYSFHMPAFVLISGMLTKSIFGNEQILKSVKTILIPFIVFTVLYEIFDLLFTGSISYYTRNFYPYWILWYLFSLFIWKMILPVIVNFKYPILISFIISIVSGYNDDVGYFLGISRTIYFFPFFLIGYLLTPKAIASIKDRFNSSGKLMLILVIFFSNIIFFSIFHEMSHEWLYGSYSYGKLGKSFVEGVGIRVLLYTISMGTLLALFLVIPDKQKEYLVGGKNSLQVYVWHGFFIKFLSITGVIYAVGAYPEYIILTIAFLFSLMLTKVLSSDFVSGITKNIFISPFVRLLLKTG